MIFKAKIKLDTSTFYYSGIVMLLFALFSLLVRLASVAEFFANIAFLSMLIGVIKNIRELH